MPLQPNRLAFYRGSYMYMSVNELLNLLNEMRKT